MERFENYDFSKACKAANAFFVSTGVSCRVIDITGKSICLFHDTDVCDIISKKLKNHSGLCDCENLHRYGMYQSERFGGSYIYFCRQGLAYFASPIMSDGVLKGALIGGGVLIVDKDEFITVDLVEKNRLGEKDKAEFVKMLRSINAKVPDYVTALSNVLKSLAKDTEDNRDIISKNEKSGDIQQRVNEYIQRAKGDSSLVSYPMEKEQRLLSAIATGDKAMANMLLNELIGHVYFKAGDEISVIRARAMELVVLLSRAAVQGGADTEQVFGLNYRYLKEIDDLDSIEQLSYWLSEIMARFIDYVFNFSTVRHLDVIKKSTDFIKNNADKKLTLDMVAAHVFLSSSYFSKLFKDEMRSSFSEYLNKTRIEISKALLITTNNTMLEICEKAGFDNQSYFTKVFKKLTGMTPAKFRKHRGRGLPALNKN